MNRPLNIAIGSDHGGFELKETLISWLQSQNHAVEDCGTVDGTTSVDYPRFAYLVARRVSLGKCDFGIVVDGAGIGSAMAANKVRGVLAAACYNETLARNAREHNGANVLTLGSGQTDTETAKQIVKVFLSTDFTEERHKKRVGLITDIESGRSIQTPSVPQTPPSSARQNLSPDDLQRISQKVQQLLARKNVHFDVDQAFNLNLSAHNVAQIIDHTLLKPDASNQDIAKLCGEAIQHKFWSVCVNSTNVREAKKHLRNSPVKLCSVVGFPLGAMPADIKALETRKAIREGADEIDMVINVGALKSGDHKKVEDDIRAVVEACRERSALSKVILETALLTDEEKVRACELSMRAGADFVKTSTGFSSGGATVQDIALMSSTVAPRKLGVKASGGVRTYGDAMKMVEAGATRIGASSSIKIVEEARAIEEGRTYLTTSACKGNY